MFHPRVIPVLLLDENRLVKTTRFADPVYVGDPLNTVRLFQEMQADELIILDITARKRHDFIQPTFVKQLNQESSMPLGIGGGINDLTHIEALLAAGAEKIVLSTAVFQQADFLKQACATFGSSTISVCMDLVEDNSEILLSRRYESAFTSKSYLDWARWIENQGAGELIVQFEQRDGTLQGYHEKALGTIAQHLSIPLVALGGASSVQEMRQLYNAYAINGFGVGKLFTFLGNSVLISYDKF